MTPDSMGNLPQKNKQTRTTTIDNSAVVRRFGHSVIASHCFFSKKFEDVEGHFSGAFLTTKNVCTQGISARVQGRDPVLGHGHRARILAWVLEKKVCSH